MFDILSTWYFFPLYASALFDRLSAWYFYLFSLWWAWLNDPLALYFGRQNGLCNFRWRLFSEVPGNFWTLTLEKDWAVDTFNVIHNCTVTDGLRKTGSCCKATWIFKRVQGWRSIRIPKFWTRMLSKKSGPHIYRITISKLLMVLDSWITLQKYAQKVPFVKSRSQFQSSTLFTDALQFHFSDAAFRDLHTTFLDSINLFSAKWWNHGVPPERASFGSAVSHCWNLQVEILYGQGSFLFSCTISLLPDFQYYVFTTKNS